MIAKWVGRCVYRARDRATKPTTMYWDGIITGLSDELGKIAEFNLRGISTETIMEKGQPPPPMETPGFDKARNILSMAAQTKTASHHVRGSGTAVGLPQVQRMTNADQKNPGVAGQATSLAGHTLAGAGAGRLAGWASQGPKMMEAGAAHSRQWKGMAIGAGLGAAAYGAKKLQQRNTKQATIVKTATLSTPAIALKASKQVGKMKVTPSASGPSTTTQIRGQLIGKKGVP